MKNFVFGIEGIQREEYRARDAFVYISEFRNPRIIAPCIRVKLLFCYVLLEPPEITRGEIFFAVYKTYMAANK